MPPSKNAQGSKFAHQSFMVEVHQGVVQLGVGIILGQVNQFDAFHRQLIARIHGRSVGERCHGPETKEPRKIRENFEIFKRCSSWKSKVLFCHLCITFNPRETRLSQEFKINSDQIKLQKMKTLGT